MKPKYALVDMDGVLVDLIGGALQHFKINKTCEEFFEKQLGNWHVSHLFGVTEPEFFQALTEEFWTNLGWMYDGKQILESVEEKFGQENVFLWTSPVATDGCYDGKKKWIWKNLSKHYHQGNRLIVGSSKFLGACPKKILIDDGDHNIDAFEKAGGHVCLVPRLWNKEHKYRAQAIDTVQRRLYYAGE